MRQLPKHGVIVSCSCGKQQTPVDKTTRTTHSILSIHQMPNHFLASPNLVNGQVLNQHLTNQGPSGRISWAAACRLKDIISALPHRTPDPVRQSPTANLRAKILDFKGLDPSRTLTVRGGILMSVGDFPEMLRQTNPSRDYLGRDIARSTTDNRAATHIIAVTGLLVPVPLPLLYNPIYYRTLSPTFDYNPPPLLKLRPPRFWLTPPPATAIPLVAISLTWLLLLSLILLIS